VKKKKHQQKIVETKKIVLKPMSLDEAIMEIEAK